MRQLVYSVAMSLDGYIAGPKGESDWIVMDPELDFDAILGRFGSVLLGRRTYETMRTQVGGAMPGMDTYVFSRTLQQADWPGVTVSEDPSTTVSALKEQPGKDIWLFGGGVLFRSLLELGLVDAVLVGIVPVLLGAGLPLLPESARGAKLRLVEHRILAKTGTVLLEYAVV